MKSEKVGQPAEIYVIPVVIATLVAAAAAWPQSPSGVGPSRVPPGPSPAKQDADIAGLFRYEPTGLSLLQPYRRGRIPVVFVHGLWSNPWSWSAMVEVLEADAALRDRYQFWTFGYSTGDPILYSASLLRRDLDEVRRKFDPDGLDAAFDRMIVVGHSMGGLLAKMMVQDSGPRLWRLLSDRPVDELAGDPEDRDLFRRALIFKPRPEVRRVVFIATPHRGSRVDRGRLERLGSRLVRLQEPLRLSYGRLMARNGPEFFKERLRKGLPTSIDELEWGSPFLTGLWELGLAAEVKAHSIIADRRDPPRAGGSDGLVPYDSAHLDGVTSESLVSSGHLCQDNPAVIREVRRILVEHGAR
jgi:pimeloyl-ACP methyl ester carboxylesterase